MPETCIHAISISLKWPIITFLVYSRNHISAIGLNYKKTPHDFRTYYFRFLETFLYKLDFLTFPKIHFGPNLILGRTYVRRTSFSGSTVRWCILQLIKCCPASENPCLEQWLTEYVKGLQILMLRMGPWAREWARYLNTTFRFLRAHSAITRYCIGPVHRGYKP